jgi:hypothetical protein
MTIRKQGPSAAKAKEIFGLVYGGECDGVKELKELNQAQEELSSIEGNLS